MMKINLQFAIATTLSLSLVTLDGWGRPAQGSDLFGVPQDFFAIQNSSRDFFQAGRDKLEQEVQHLEQGTFELEDLLNISEDLLLEQEQFQSDQANDLEAWLNQDFVEP